MTQNLIHQNLAKFGFSAYEAKAYIALLSKSPITGYELAKISNVPPSKIYEVIQKLLDKSVIIPIQNNPIKYLPQDIDIFIKKIEDETSGAITQLRQNLPKAKNSASHYIWDIRTRDELTYKAEELIRNCNDELLLFLWDEELVRLLPVLRKKKIRKLAIVQYGSLPVDCGVVYHHEMPAEKKEEKGGREFTLVADNAHLLQAILTDSQSVLGVWTTNQSLVDVAKDFIRHDIYCWKLINKGGPSVKKLFGADYSRLRDIYEK